MAILPQLVGGGLGARQCDAMQRVREGEDGGRLVPEGIFSYQSSLLKL